MKNGLRLSVFVVMMMFLGILSTGSIWAGDLEFSLRINGMSSGSSPAHEAAMALWNDPMNHLIRDTNAELGRILVGQPGGMTAPLIGVSFRYGVPPAVISGIIENSLLVSQQRVLELDWNNPPSDEEIQERFIEEFRHQLEASVGRKESGHP